MHGVFGLKVVTKVRLFFAVCLGRGVLSSIWFNALAYALIHFHKHENAYVYVYMYISNQSEHASHSEEEP